MSRFVLAKRQTLQILTSGLWDAVTITPMVDLVFLERSVASSPILNMTWSSCVAMVLNPAVPYCRTNPGGFGCRLELLLTSGNKAATEKIMRKKYIKLA